MFRLSLHHSLYRLVLCALLGSTAVLPAAAQAFIIRPDARPAEVELRRHRVEARVQEQVAVVTVEHVFFNPGPGTVEGSFLFPLPAGAQVSRFSMEVDGKEMAGELLDADQARQVYEDIVRRSLDPALLEMADYRTFRARIFPIPPGAYRTVTLRYDATLPREGRTVTFQYPRRGVVSTRQTPGIRPPSGPSASNEGSSGSEIRVVLSTETALRTIYSPSHDVDVDRKDNRHALVTLGQDDTTDGRDFVLYYSLDADPIGATLLTHRPYGDRPGYFLLLLSPPADAADAAPPRKDVVFVLDTSGSMAGEKIDQAKDALRYCLARLGPQDRFGLVAFSTDADAFRDRLAGPGARGDARFFIDQLEARGGTNIHDALQKALSMLEGSRNGLVVFLTDGLPSSGVTDESAIRQRIADANRDGVRLFSFGVGYDVNTRLLDGLSQASGAFADYISPDEHIEARVSAFYDKIRFPVLTDLEMAFDGADVFALTPGALPDLYRGGQILLAGRYRRPGKAALTLDGRLGDRQTHHRYTLTFPEVERERDFVARLWATRRVGQLLDEIRLHGENAELKDEVIALAKEFGLVTPYTSYLVLEDETMPIAGRPVPRPQGFFDRILRQSEAADAAPTSANAVEEAMAQTTGAQAVAMSKSLRAMQEAETTTSPERAGVVAVQGRTMRRDADGAWVDAAFDADADQPTRIRFASDAYFDLLRRHPEARAFARLGRQVIFYLGNGFIEVFE